MSHNDEERRQWVDNDEGLYDSFRSSRLGMREFVRQNREFLDSVIETVTSGRKPAHYLKYDRGLSDFDAAESCYVLPKPVFMQFVSTYDRTAIWPPDLPLPPDVDEHGDRRFDIETGGMYGTIRKVVGLAIEKAEDGVLVHGDRCLLNAQESGYQLEGRVSIGGKKYRAFTASQMFLHGSKLYDFAILYVVRSKS